MKIGYLLLVHEEFEVIQYLLKALIHSSNDQVFIHIDKKSGALSQIQEQLKEAKNVHFIEALDIEWGEASIVQATISGMKEANKYDLDYLVLLSGSCMPICKREDLVSYLNANPQDFIECHNIKNGKWAKDGLESERWEHYNIFNWRNDPIYFSLTHKIQSMLKIKRRLPGNLDGYMGSQWWCLRSDTVEKVLEFIKINKVENFIKYTWIPDEFIIQSIVHKIKSGSDISNILMNYRFNDVGIPKVYVSSDINELNALHGVKFFTRKINKNDVYLKKYLADQYIGNDVSLGSLPTFIDKTSKSVKKYLTDSCAEKLNRVFVILCDEKNSFYPKEILQKFGNREYNFFNELYSSKGIFFSNDSEKCHDYYKREDITIRDYSLDVFSGEILDKSVNFFLCNIDDFDKINYSLRNFQLVTYIINPGILDKENLLKSLKINRHILSQGMGVILSQDINVILENIDNEIRNFNLIENSVSDNVYD